MGLTVGAGHHRRGRREPGLASRNLANVLVVEPRYADPLSLVHYKKVLVTKGAIEQARGDAGMNAARHSSTKNAKAERLMQVLVGADRVRKEHARRREAQPGASSRCCATPPSPRSRPPSN